MRKKTIEEHVRAGTLRMPRHRSLMTDAQAEAYDRAGGGEAGLHALARLIGVERDVETDLLELHRRAWATPEQILALRYSYYGGPAEAAWNDAALELDEARHAYRRAVSPEYADADDRGDELPYVPVADPPAGLRGEWFADRREQIAALVALDPANTETGA